MHRFFAALLTMVSALAMADEPPATLSVKPLLCIVDQRTPSCTLRFDIVWQSPKTGYYCVFNELEPAALRCWNNARTGDVDDERTVAKSFRYHLSEGEDQTQLAEATVEVLRKDSDDRRRRRRTKHVWDLL